MSGKKEMTKIRITEDARVNKRKFIGLMNLFLETFDDNEEFDVKLEISGKIPIKRAEAIRNVFAELGLIENGWLDETGR